MKAAKYVVLALVVLALPVALYLGLKYSKIQGFNRINNQYQMQGEQVNNRFNTCWTIIKQETQCTDAVRASFERIYPELMAARGTDKGGLAMKWVQENLPNFEIGKNFDHLMSIIEVQRTQLERENKTWLDIAREFNTFVDDPITKWFIGEKPHVAPQIIVASGAKGAIDSRIESDTDLNLGQSAAAEKTNAH